MPYLKKTFRFILLCAILLLLCACRGSAQPDSYLSEIAQPIPGVTPASAPSAPGSDGASEVPSPDNTSESGGESKVPSPDHTTESGGEAKPPSPGDAPGAQKEELASGQGAQPSSEPYRPVTIGCVGDVYLNEAIYQAYLKSDNSTDSFLANGLADHFQEVDLMLINHEYASTDVSADAKDTRQLYNFKAPTEREFLLKEMGVDVVSLANNHMLDYGRQGLLDTLEILEQQQIARCGAGTDLNDALKPAMFEQNGKKIAFLAASRVVVNVDWYATEKRSGVLTTYESTKYFPLICEEITRLKEEEGCDFVVIYVHFGEERENLFRDYQETVAHGYIDAGADLVFGGHAHTLQGVEIYKDKPIYYNLGNFLFGRQQTDTIFVEVTIAQDNSCTTRILPCQSRSYVATLCEDKERERILQYMESISKNVAIDENGCVTLKPDSAPPSDPAPQPPGEEGS